MRDTTTDKTSTAALLHSGVTVPHEPQGPSADVPAFVPTLVSTLAPTLGATLGPALGPTLGPTLLAAPVPTHVPAPDADLGAVFQRQLLAHRRLFAELATLADTIAEAAEHMSQALAAGGRLFFFGNGGSACDSMHIAAELTGRLKTDRQPLAAMALNADVAALTAIGNDYGFEAVFARQLQGLARPGDCAVALSTSGNSPNVLQALKAARAGGVTTIALLGRGGGSARQLADLALVVPNNDSARIQEAHIFVGHTWCAQIESRLGLASH